MRFASVKLQISRVSSPIFAKFPFGILCKSDCLVFAFAFCPNDYGMCPKVIEIYGVPAVARIRQSNAPPLENDVEAHGQRACRRRSPPHVALLCLRRRCKCVFGRHEWVACDACDEPHFDSPLLWMYLPHRRGVCDATRRRLYVRMEKRSSLLHNASQRSLTAIRVFSVLPAFVCAIHGSHVLLKTESGKPNEWRTQTRENKKKAAKFNLTTKNWWLQTYQLVWIHDDTVLRNCVCRIVNTNFWLVPTELCGKKFSPFCAISVPWRDFRADCRHWKRALSIQLAV